MKKFFERIIDFFKSNFEKLLKIDDSPHKIAFGFGLGVFMGIMPGVGPLATLALAFLFRVNKVSALIGSVLTNSWLSLLTLVISIKIGSAILGVEWYEIYEQYAHLLKHISWNNLIDYENFEIFIPILVGYIVVAAVAGLLSYFVMMFILLRKKKRISQTSH